MCQDSRDSKITHLDSAIGSKENIIGLDISMQYFLAMKVGQSKRNLYKPINNNLLRKMKPMSALPFNVIGQISLFAVFHYDDKLFALIKALNELYYKWMS